MLGLSSVGQTPRRTQRPRQDSGSQELSQGTKRTVMSGFIVDTQFFLGQSKSVAVPQDLVVDPATNNEFDVLSTSYTLKLGWASPSGFYLGALYTQRQDKRVHLAATMTTKGSGAGAGLGFLGDNGLSARLFYRFSESYGDFSSGDGFSAEVAYLVKISSKMFLGLTITHQQVQYLKNPTVANFQKQSAKWTYPALTLAYATK